MQATFVSCALALCLASADDPTPFFDARQHQSEYAGPGRDNPPPTDLSEIAVGYFGPADPGDPRAGDMWRAAELAVEEANGNGGFQGTPFRLVAAWSRDPWDAAVKQLTELVFRHHVWAIVGGADSASSHLAEQVVAKARVPLICPVSSDKTVNLANVPWTFSVVPGDQRLAPLLAEAVAQHPRPLTVVRLLTEDHDSRLFSSELDRALLRRDLAVKYEFVVPTRNDGTVVAQALDTGPDMVLVIAGPADSARVVTQLRSHGFAGPILGGPALGRRQFLLAAADAADGILFPLLYQPQDNPSDFAERFRQRFGYDPDYSAAHTFDAVRLTLTAIRKAGLNRARIRDAIAGLGPYTGVTGNIVWDGLGSNTRSAQLGTIREGRVQSVVALRDLPLSQLRSVPP